uniref:Uncharacterized protein n=1 Tax=Bubo bubo TaxID=30461 RepID=A0A8C0EU47_BUBBB
LHLLQSSASVCVSCRLAGAHNRFPSVASSWVEQNLWGKGNALFCFFPPVRRSILSGCGLDFLVFFPEVFGQTYNILMLCNEQYRSKCLVWQVPVVFIYQRLDVSNSVKI